MKNKNITTGKDVFEAHKFEVTTTYFDGYLLTVNEIKILKDLIEDDNHSYIFTEFADGMGSKIFVDEALRYINDEYAEENALYNEATPILRVAISAGVDVITFYR